MKIQMEAKELANLVSVAAQAISSKPMKPENECVYVSARKNEGIPLLTVIGKDVGIAIQKVTERVEVIDGGDALIPAKTLLSFLKLIDGDMTLTVDEKNAATLKAKGKKINIACIGGAEYEPGLTVINDAKECRMNGMDYAKLVNSVAHCINPNETGRIVLTGVDFTFDGTKPQNGAEACGMDGFRMAISRGNVETNESFTALVPVTSAKLVQKVIGDREDVSFRFGKGVMIAEAYDTAIEVSMLAGEYIDYPLMLPKEHTLRLKVKTEELLNATQIAMVSASEGKKDMIVLKIIDEDTIQVIAMADKSGAVTAVNCMVEGNLTNKDGLSDGNEVAFNGRYIEDCLKAQMAYSEESIIEFKSRGSPMVVLPVGREDFYQLVLPVRRT